MTEPTLSERLRAWANEMPHIDGGAWELVVESADMIESLEKALGKQVAEFAVADLQRTQLMGYLERINKEMRLQIAMNDQAANWIRMAEKSMRVLVSEVQCAGDDYVTVKREAVNMARALLDQMKKAPQN